MCCSAPDTSIARPQATVAHLPGQLCYPVTTRNCHLAPMNASPRFSLSHTTLYGRRCQECPAVYTRVAQTFSVYDCVLLHCTHHHHSSIYSPNSSTLRPVGNIIVLNRPATCPVHCIAAFWCTWSLRGALPQCVAPPRTPQPHSSVVGHAPYTLLCGVRSR